MTEESDSDDVGRFSSNKKKFVSDSDNDGEVSDFEDDSSSDESLPGFVVGLEHAPVLMKRLKSITKLKPFWSLTDEMFDEQMNLSIVNKKLKNSKYKSFSQFIDNIGQTWSNACEFYDQNSQLYRLAKKYKKKCRSCFAAYLEVCSHIISFVCFL